MASLQEMIEAKNLANRKQQQEQLLGDDTTSQIVKPRTLSDLLAQKHAIMSSVKSSATNFNPAQQKIVLENPNVSEEKTIYKETFSLDIVLNKEQLLAKEMAFNGKSFCLIGAAGTGKTTAQREIAAELLRQDLLGTHDFRIQGTGMRVTAPSIAFVAYTRIASGNLRRAIHKDPALEEVFKHNITTIHNLLEYEPVYYWDYEKNVERFKFSPKRTASNPLTITHLVIEESSMVGLDLWEELYDALPSGVQIIFIGDINQLPPVFGSSILNYALVQLPIVELHEVYRQKDGSGVLENAHRVLRGEKVVEGPDFKIIRAGDKQLGQEKMSISIGQTFPKWKAVGEYDPEQDMILSPFNKQDLGTDNINRWIAQSLGQERNAVVYEIQAGIRKLYLAVGDKVLYQKQVGYITAISRNYEYLGRNVKAHSQFLTRFGTYLAGHSTTEEEEDWGDYSHIDLDKMLESQDEEDRVKECSHVVHVTLETGEDIVLHTTGDFNPATFSLGYCLTIHKAQGCEWRKVFLILHKDHSIMAYRELLYTAITRAREQCIIIAKDFMIQKAIDTQRIKGNTITDKLEYFNGGILNQDGIYCTKD